MKSVSVVHYPPSQKTTDVVTLEGPLSIDVVYGSAAHRKWSRLTTTMRSPGHDHELVIGLLYSLGIIEAASDVIALVPCERSRFDKTHDDTVTVYLDYDRPYRPLEFSAGHPRYSGCGLCGSHELPKNKVIIAPRVSSIDVTTMLGIPKKIAQHQRIFLETGGSHGAALFDAKGDMCAMFEDVGRHNALDKLIGHRLSTAKDLRDGIVVMTSRASYEIIQKAAVAKSVCIAVMGAVSSVAVEQASMYGITLIGFLRSTRLNVYTHPERIRGL